MHTCLQRELEHKNAPEIKRSKRRREQVVGWGGGVLVLGRIGVMLDEPNQILDRLGLNEQV